MRPQAFRVLAALVLLVSLLTFAPKAHAGGAVASGSTVPGTLGGPGFSETWTFAGTIGDHVVFTAVVTGAAANLTLTLKAPGGAIATQNGGNRLDFQLTSSGTWTFVIPSAPTHLAFCSGAAP